MDFTKATHHQLLTICLYEDCPLTDKQAAAAEMKKRGMTA